LLKNKTTKTFFVAEIHSLIMNFNLSPYFFLVVFFAFFAGAFFVAMDFSPPFIRRKSILFKRQKKLYEITPGA